MNLTDTVKFYIHENRGFGIKHYHTCTMEWSLRRLMWLSDNDYAWVTTWPTFIKPAVICDKQH